MSGPTFYESLMQRQKDTATYRGKLILKKDEVRWHTSPQGRNAALVDLTTGLEAKTFGIVLSEIPPGGQSGLHQHTFEAVGYVLEGRGHEIIGDQRVDWEAGDTYYMPPNVPHRHVNGDPERPARILLIEAWPLAVYLGTSRLDQLEDRGPSGEPPGPAGRAGEAAGR